MSLVESNCPRVGAFQIWLSVGTLAELELVRLYIQVLAEKHPKQPLCDDESPAVSLKVKPLSSCPFVAREHLCQLIHVCGGLFKRRMPNMDLGARYDPTGRGRYIV